MGRHDHIQFKKHWELLEPTNYMLGQCEAFVDALTNVPLKPEYRRKLLSVSLVKGAQATTAIEGNTLSEEDIAKIQRGQSEVPPSKMYQKIEVENIINAFNELLREITSESKDRFISPGLIKQFHKMIGKGLGEHFDAIPGKYRDDNRVVGNYLAPDHKKVPRLIEQLCEWTKKEFHFTKGQSFKDAVIQAIVTHVYIEWIHPFGDGNGRTGRLIEFYILLRKGLPSIVSHILSNFYNETRPEYYRQIEKATKLKDLTHFLHYAVQGFRDGLAENLKVIQASQFDIFWCNYIYDSFADVKFHKREVFKRKRSLMLQMPTEQELTPEEITMVTPEIAQKYSGLTITTVKRDLSELEEMGLIKKIGKKYMANTEILRKMIPPSRPKRRSQ